MAALATLYTMNYTAATEKDYTDAKIGMDALVKHMTETGQTARAIEAIDLRQAWEVDVRASALTAAEKNRLIGA